ncbi:IS21 family transposase [Pseudorhodoferax sp.]|uniref:IS21 family transposase n=1 Tax=Pseudorhodoferax sp. TaxID=1993553 RepID=UPI0039E22464
MHEALDEPWTLSVSTLSPDATLEPAQFLGQRLTLWSRLADGSELPRSGLVTQAIAEDADGGFARYRLTMQPWLALLAHSRRSQVWQGRSVVEIVESLFAAYPQAAWQWAPCVAAHLQTSAHAGVRSYTVQYRESDLAFVQRLLAREGIAMRLQRQDDAPLGHALVLLADSPGRAACPEDVVSAGVLGALDTLSSAGGAGVRFHASGAQQMQDAVQAFGGRRRLPVAATTVLAWDYKAKRAVATSVPTAAAFAGPPALEDFDDAGAYAFADTADAERAAQLMQQQAHEARHKAWIGRSTVRSFTAGHWFHLTGSELDALPGLSDQPDSEHRRFLLTAVTHAGINNLPKDFSDAIARALGAPPLDVPGALDTSPPLDAELRAQAAATGYGNAFTAIRASVPWRPQLLDGTGARRHPVPSAPGLLTATVVGPDGQERASGPEEIHMDRLGRVRIRFDFQCLPQGPETSTASTWVRVLQRWAGAGMGAQFIPRIGQGVLVDFVDGNVERPLVVGALYNGRGEAGLSPTPGGMAAQDDTGALATSGDHRPGAQGNLIGAGPGGHGPAWHGAGHASLQAAGQANAAALSGTKTQEFGGPGFNQLVFDDTDAQLRTQLATSQHATQLNLGHLIHQADNHRGSLRGAGFELRTDAYGAIRAGQGVLLSSYGTQVQEPAGDNVADMALQGQLATLARTFSQAAGIHQTVKLAEAIGSVRTDQSALDDTQPPARALHTVLKGLVSVALQESPVVASEISPPIDNAKEREMDKEVQRREQDVAAPAATVPVRERSMEVAVVGQEPWQAIRERGAVGQAVSLIAREMGLDRKTVRSCLRREKWKPYSREVARPTLLDAHMDWLRARAPQVGFSARVLYQELRSRGFSGCDEVVKVAVRPLRANASVAAVTQMRFESAPGEQAQVDWGQVKVWFGGQPARVHVFVMTLGYSRRGYAEGYLNERMDSLLSAHERAFAHFGGVCQTLLYDRMRTGTIGTSEDDTGVRRAKLNAIFQAFAGHWGFVIRLCHPYRAQTKGKVESVVKYIKRNFVPGRQFRDLQDFNAQLAAWQAEIADVRVHGTTHQRPIDRFAEEAGAR